MVQNELFDCLFAEAEIAKFTKNELREYEDSLKAYRDIKNSLDSAEEKAEQKAELRVEQRERQKWQENCWRWGYL